MGIAKQQQAQTARLKAIDDVYRAALAKAEAKFNKVYDAMTSKHGLNITQLMDHNAFPPEFHADIAEARAAYRDEIMAAQQAQRSGAANLPRPRGARRVN